MSMGIQGHMDAGKFVEYYLHKQGTISVADGVDQVVIGHESVELVDATAAVDNNGTTSGDTGFMLARIRAGGADVDLFSAPLDIANDSATNFANLDKGTIQNKTLQKGDLLSLNFDTIPGGSDSADGAIRVLCRIRRY